MKWSGTSAEVGPDQVVYSLIRVSDGNLAFELHQRLLEGEADFTTLASSYSEGSERSSGGRYGPVPFNQAHATVVEKLRGCQEGELLEPFFLEDIWVILRLDHWGVLAWMRPCARPCWTSCLSNGWSAELGSCLLGRPPTRCHCIYWSVSNSSSSQVGNDAVSFTVTAPVKQQHRDQRFRESGAVNAARICWSCSSTNSWPKLDVIKLRVTRPTGVL